MENHFVVLANGPWYELFYNLAFVITLAVILFEGFRRKIPVLKWIILIVITRILFIAGTKIITFSAPEWNYLFTHWHLPHTSGKSLLGGILFGGFGLLAGYHFLRFKQPIADAFALVLPLGVAIQRLGCFTAGCCYGKISHLPWAVQYPEQTLPHYHQFTDKLLTYADTLSLPVHPVQLYEMLGLLLVLIILIRVSKMLKRPGSLFLLSLGLLFFVRFISEFFRDAHAHTIGGEMVWIFNTIQLVLLPVFILLFLMLFRRESKSVPSLMPVYDKEIRFLPALLILSVLFLLLKSMNTWFDFTELTALWITLSVAIFITAYRFFTEPGSSPYLKWYPAVFILPLFLMAQSLPYEQQDSVTIKKYNTLKFGFGTGNYENSYTIGQGSGCDRVSDTEYFKQKYSLAAAAFEVTEQLPGNLVRQYGVKTMFGNHREIRISDGYEKSTDLFSVSPYYNFDYKWIGAGAGVHVGNNSFILENLNIDGVSYPESGSKNFTIYPQLYFRFGPRNWIYAEYHLADHFPSALPGFRHQIGIGSGLGLENGTSLHFGSNTMDILYFSGYLPIENRVVVEPILLWGKSPYQEKTFYQFSMGISYRFNFRDKTIAKQEVSSIK